MNANKMALDALEKARWAIESMKQEAETGGVGDEEMLRYAVEHISQQGLDAGMAIREAMAALAVQNYTVAPQGSPTVAEPARALKAVQVEPVAYCVYFPDDQRQEFCQDLDELIDDLTNCRYEVMPLFATPQEAVPKIKAVQVEPEPSGCVVNGTFYSLTQIQWLERNDEKHDKRTLVYTTPQSAMQVEPASATVLEADRCFGETLASNLDKIGILGAGDKTAIVAASFIRRLIAQPS